MSSLKIKSMNPFLIQMQYAVRGPIVVRAAAIEKELGEGNSKPFDKVIRANIGDCHATGQKPLTFPRQVMACCAYPKLLKLDMPSDVKKKAKKLLKACAGYSVGSYSHSSGLELVRKHVAEYITERDHYPSETEDIFLGAGATDCIKNVLKLFQGHSSRNISGIMTPIPQYPLYSAVLVENNMKLVPYYLNEEEGWSLDTEELERAYNKGKRNCIPRAIVVINPGNPTGQVLTKKNIKKIIKFAYKHNLMVLADEVYQHNVYDKDSEFFSFKKVMMEMGEPYCHLELASFMSCSKGYMGECGVRGGYVEVINIDPKVKAHYVKGLTACLCPSILSQVCMDCVAKPPKKGDPSYKRFIKEKCDVLESLEERAKMVMAAFGKMKGFNSQKIQGAMYVFPKIELPKKAIEAAKEQNKPPDVFYCFQLLENTGICVVPGSGFGQKPGTYHFRTTILPQPHILQDMLDKFKGFHEKFVKEYGD